jgi:hypothetical protein
VPLLEIRRDSGYADRVRAYEVWIDDAVIGEIRDGEVKQFPVASGDHELRIKIDWCGSQPVKFSIGEEGLAAFQAKSGLRGGWIVGARWCVLFARDSWVKLNRVN